MKKTILLLGILWGSVFAWEWSKPQLIARDAGYYLAVDNQGVCWATGAPTFYKYDDGTSSWLSMGKIPSSVWGGSLPVGYFDKGDTLWVFNGNQDQIYYVRYYGGNWSDVDTVRAFPGGNSPAEVAVDSAGGVWVCWVWLMYEVACNRYKDGVWDEPQLIPDTMPGQDWGWDVTTDALGRVWFFWYIVGNESNSLHCRYNEGSVWSEQMLIRETGVQGYIGSMDFAPDSEGGIWAVWSMYSGDSIFIEAQRCENGEWGSTDTIVNAGIFSGGFGPMPRIAVDAYGRAWSVWRQAVVPKDAYCDIYYSFNSGQGWSEPKPVDTNPAIDQLPDIAVDGAGRVWCVWSSNREGEDEWDYGAWASYTMSTGVEEQVETQAVTLVVQTITTTPKISYALPNGQSGSISIYDAVGRRLESRKVQGSGEVSFPSNLPSGVYFVRMHSDEFEAHERVVLLK